jgi:ABC-type phosphate transport system substrate-binding protein
MRPISRSLALAVGLALLVGAVPAAPTADAQTKQARLMLVVNAENKLGRLDRGTLRQIYLGQTTFWANQVRIRPYNRVHDGAAGKPFFRDVLGMTPARYRHTWQKQQLSGQGVAPEVVASAASIVAKVAANAGAIGYILDTEASAVDERVRLIPLE